MKNENNFSCDKKHFFFIPEHRTRFQEDKVLYLDKGGKQLTCPICQSLELKSIPKSNGLGANLGTFSMMSLTQKQAHLKERSRKHTITQIRDPRDD